MKKNKNIKITSITSVKDLNNKNKSEQTTRLVSGFIFILFVVYLGGYVVTYLNKPTIPYTKIDTGTNLVSEKIDGVIIRDETIYKAKKTGIVTYFVSDLEKIKANTLVATISDQETIDKIKTELEKIDENIWKLQEQRGDLSLVQKDAKKLDKQVKTYVNNNLIDFSVDNVDNLYVLKDEVDKSINLRNQLLIEDSHNSISSISSEKNTFLQGLYESQDKVASDKSGILCYYVDGLEEVYNLNSLPNLSEDFTKEKSSIDFTTALREVKEGDRFFKILNSNTWYIASYIKSNLIKDWEVGTRRNIYVIDGKVTKKLDVTIKDLIRKDKQSYVVFESRTNLLDFAEKRFVKFTVSEGEEQGLKIPYSAITKKTILKIPEKYLSGRYNDNVIILDSNNKQKEIFINRFINSENGNAWIYQYFGQIQLNDTIVNKNDSSDTYKITDYQDIYGVYKIYSGYTSLAQIYIDDLPNDNSGYVILSQATGKNLRNGDIIVTDPSSIKESQKIYLE